MKLKELLYSLKENSALLHYNIATFEQLKAGVEAVKETKIPLIIGLSEGERAYFGKEFVEEIIDEIKDLKLPLFFNADHCKSIKNAKECIKLGFDSVVFDGGVFPLSENIKKTKKIVEYRNKIKDDVLIEGEVGYLPGHSSIFKNLKIERKYFTNPEDAERFVKETKVDLLAISVGNVHGIPKNIIIDNKKNKKIKIDFERIKEIKKRVKIPLVLHGGSGLTKNEYLKAIRAGIKIIHINTEFRIIWKKEISKNLKKNLCAPYEILKGVIEALKKRIIYYQKLFIQGGSI